ncbi:MAG: zinc ABC transporter substrate-binding protein [Alphaproteobacteria bacterium]|nr:zinc ABC transporter substrate-binding protein [Alphaproteobacteria bacterium]MBU1562785.1 zinc ABC transporter substrate-binding protein [Alphaproteobacteria bacterium]MBU2303541.1 zinc ABC transporter substrate-binding protein [Alphaproteobacteria bacterium]MBU2367066.1 zinc ABC transporter substrate-binding protein [Alphaproteobacteria bacterium]
MKLLAPLSLLATAFLSTTAIAAPSVVASIKPVHSLVSAVMAGVGEPTLIVKGSASPHTYALRPSDAGALEAADIVFWTGHGMELFLGDALDTLATGATVVELADAPGITLLPVREGGAFEAHAHDEAGHEDEHAHDADEHDHDEHGEGDMHFWLDPQNAKLMVTQIATTLAEADPENATAYQANAEAELVRLDALEAELAAMLAPVADKPFIVFHDAYQYFEARFGLNLAGSVTVTPDTMPGAARIDELKAKLAELGVTCVFAEPNFEPTIISAITEGTPAKAGVLDPEGGALTEGVDLYPDLLRGLATSLVDCLG